ncbi:MAG: hypothetical protein AMXMBFR6_04180 [Betaproteobacteria bacterium]|nr:urease accessory protein UreE [Rhodocyclaceae bacterium]
MVVLESLCEGSEPAADSLLLGYADRCKSRLRTRLASGEEAALFLPRGSVLRDGDRLRARDGRIVEVRAAPEALMEVGSAEALRLVRAAYHLGNRHVAVEIGPGRLRFVADPVLARMLVGLGFEVAEKRAPFQPEAGAYAGDHRHGDEAGPARIHSYHR